MPSKTDTFLVLAQNGVTREQAKRSLKTTDQGVYGIVHALRSRGITLTLNEEGKYRAETEEKRDPQSKDNIIPESALKGLSLVDPQYFDETLGVLEQALFYQKVFAARVQISAAIRRIKHA